VKGVGPKEWNVANLNIKAKVKTGRPLQGDSRSSR